MHRDITERKKGEIIRLLSEKGRAAEVGEMMLSMTFRTVVTLIGSGLGGARSGTHIMMASVQDYVKAFLNRFLFLGAAGALDHPFSVTQVYD